MRLMNFLINSYSSSMFLLNIYYVCIITSGSSSALLDEDQGYHSNH